jgi:BirA family transcriptional regulator, biotin operon repressor / biotin---[acetyl-CoA-carboxylase] ligase
LFVKNHIQLDDVSSTNLYLRKLIKDKSINENILVSTNYQEKGRGQRSNIWESEKNMNILISFLYVHTTNNYDLFKFNMLISLAIYDFLFKYFKTGLKIKWPNDLMINNKKIAGVLIQNIESNFKSIIGVGININQKEFKNFSPQATSFSNELNKEFNRNTLILELMNNFENYLINYFQFNDLKNSYMLKIYKFKQQANFLNNLKEFKGEIMNFNSSGEIIIKSGDEFLSFKNGEVKMIF